MSDDDAIHNPNPATNAEQAQNPAERIMEQPNVTESPVEATLLNTVEDASKTMGEVVREIAGENADNPLLGDQTDETDRMYRRGRGRPTLKMTKEQLMAAIGEVAEKLGHVPSHAELMRSGKGQRAADCEAFWHVHASATGVQSGAQHGWEEASSGETVSGLGKSGAGTEEDSQQGGI